MVDMENNPTGNNVWKTNQRSPSHYWCTTSSSRQQHYQRIRQRQRQQIMTMMNHKGGGDDCTQQQRRRRQRRPRRQSSFLLNYYSSTTDCNDCRCCCSSSSSVSKRRRKVTTMKLNETFAVSLLLMMVVVLSIIVLQPVTSFMYTSHLKQHHHNNHNAISSSSSTAVGDEVASLLISFPKTTRITTTMIVQQASTSSSYPEEESPKQTKPKKKAVRKVVASSSTTLQRRRSGRKKRNNDSNTDDVLGREEEEPSLLLFKDVSTISYTSGNGVKQPKPSSAKQFKNFNKYEHRLLTKEEELSYSKQRQRGQQLRQAIDLLLEEKYVNFSRSSQTLEDTDLMMDEWNLLMGGSSTGNGDVWDDGYQAENHLYMLPSESSLITSTLSENDCTPKQSGSIKNGFALLHEYTQLVSSNSPFYVSPTELAMLSVQDDIIERLGLQGGLSELYQILMDAQRARQTLLKHNLKLVVSIARKWRKSAASASTQPSSQQQSSTTSSDHTPSSNEDETMEVPSLEELVQEGVLGLSKAIDKFDPESKNRLSTYATYWITSYVRMAVTQHKLSTVKLPPDLYQIQRKYYNLVKEIQQQQQSMMSSSINGTTTNELLSDDDEDYETEEHSTPKQQEHLVSLEMASVKLGVPLKRLELALLWAQPGGGGLLSLDAPLSISSSQRGTNAGLGMGVDDNSLTLLDTLSTELALIKTPEEYVDQSILRQLLERLMCSELSPYERDVIRLRLGLDGFEENGMTVRQIMEFSTSTSTRKSSSSNDEEKNAITHVRNAERRAYKKLRHPSVLQNYRLIDFLQE